MIKEKNYNIIEFSRHWYSEENDILTCLYKNKIKIFNGKSLFEDFLNFLEQQPQKHIFLYLVDPTPFYIEMLKNFPRHSRWEQETFIVKSKVYSINLINEDKIIKIINLNHLIGEDLITEKTEVMGINYTYIPYWNHIDLKEKESSETLRNSFFEKWLKHTDINEDFISKDKSSKDFLTEKDLIKKQNATKQLYLNLTILNTKLHKINDNLALLSIYWDKKLSLSSISLMFYNKNFDFQKLNWKKKIELDQALRLGYYGGRCEVFGNNYEETEKIVHYDFPNMYGEILKTDFPIGEIEKIYNVQNVKAEGFYYIKAYSNSKIPVLPHKTDFFQKEKDLYDLANREDMVFSNGEFEGLYYKEELELFLENGGEIREIAYAWIFKEKPKPIFKTYAETLIKLRNEKNHKIWKKLLVSFYGRLGMKPETTETRVIKKSEYTAFRKNNYQIQKEIWITDYVIIEVLKNEINDVKSLVEHAMIITARARIKLYKTMLEVLKNEGRLLYCDTDSLFIAVKKNNDIKKKFFKLIKWENTNQSLNIKKAVFASIRCYSLLLENETWETKIAGIPRNFLSFEMFEKSFYNWENRLFEEEDFKTSIKTKINWKTWRESKIIVLNSYEKRKFSKDLKTTTPLHKFKNNFF